MKNSKFLLALALPAVFAACSNEEIATEAPKNNTEIVGANLVSEGLVINAGKNGVDSRLDANGWSATDKLGLGWVNAAGNIYADQSSDTKTTDVRVYANHMFQQNANGSFTTYGNVYEGWHFAYYAYQYMPQVGQLEVTVNPEQKDSYLAEHYSNTFHISAQDYIEAANVDANTKELKDKTFEVVPAVNELAFRIIPSEQFTEDEILSALNIRSIALTTTSGKTPFYSTIALAPRKLPVAKFDKNGEYDSEATLEQMTAANLYKAAIVRGAGNKTLTTTVTGEEYDLSGTQTLRMFNTPVVAGDLTTKADASKYSIKIQVAAGYFTIKYNKNAEEGSYEASNNEALKEIAGLLSEEGYGDDEINFTELIERSGVTLKLNASMFTADYSKITCKEDWEQCVALADALGEEGTIKFNVTGEVKFDEGTIPMPSCNVAVSTSSKGALVIENDVTWPTTLAKTADKNLVINVTETGTLNVNSVVNATSFENNGLINAGPLASICTKQNNIFVNNNRVIVEYGAYVYPATGKEGVIAFEVEDATQTTIGKINVLINDTYLQAANVNTLMVSTNLSLNALASSIGASSDRYTGTSGASSVELASLEDVTVELFDGATLSSTGDVNESVANIIVKGQSEIIDIKTVNGNVTVEEDAELTISSSYENALDKTVLDVTGDIVVLGTLNAETNAVCANIDNKVGTTNVAEGYAIVYNNKYYQGGTAHGTIAKQDAWLDGVAQAGGEVKMVCDVTLTETLNVEEELTLNLNTKTIQGSIQTNADLTVKNGSVVNNNKNVSAIEINAGELALENVVVTSARHAVRIDGQVEAVIKSGTYKTTGDAALTTHALNVSGKAKVTISGGTFVGPKGTEGDSGAAVYVQAGAEVVIEGGNFSGGKNNTLNGPGKITVKGGTFDQDPTAYVATGYKATQNGSTWTVTKK